MQLNSWPMQIVRDCSYFVGLLVACTCNEADHLHSPSLLDFTILRLFTPHSVSAMLSSNCPSTSKNEHLYPTISTYKRCKSLVISLTFKFSFFIWPSPNLMICLIPKNTIQCSFRLQKAHLKLFFALLPISFDFSSPKYVFICFSLSFFFLENLPGDLRSWKFAETRFSVTHFLHSNYSSISATLFYHFTI